MIAALPALAATVRFDPSALASLRGPHTEALQGFLDGPGDTLVIPARTGGYVTGPLHIRRSGVVVRLERGVVIRAAKGGFGGRWDCLLTMSGVEDVTLLGRGARLVMRKGEYTEGEWRHAVKLAGVSRVHIEGLSIDSSGGDGLYIGSHAEKGGLHYSEDVSVKACHLRGHRRQGISVISVRRLLLDSLVVEGTSGTAPESGIDFEPNEPNEYLEDIVVRRSVFRGHANHAALMWLGKLHGTSHPVSITFEDSRFAGSRGNGLYITGFRKPGLKGRIVVRRCRLEDNGSHALEISDKPLEGPSVVVEASVLRQGFARITPRRNTPASAIAVGWSETDWPRTGGITITGGRIETAPGVPVFRESPRRLRGIEALTIEAYTTAGSGDVPRGVLLKRLAKDPLRR